MRCLPSIPAGGPGTALGVIFVTLEDETGQANIVVWPRIAEAQGKPLLQSLLLKVTGTGQRMEFCV
jgi:error-prone DNA polymerase